MTLAPSPLSLATPLDMSRGLLALSQTQITVQGQHHLPADPSTRVPLVVVSNHRSIMDAPLIMSAVGRPVRFACHHYLSQVPGLRTVVSALGCLPLDSPTRGQTAFFRRAMETLAQGEAVGIFPEGAAPMVHRTAPNHLSAFHRGFAHLALRAPVDELLIVPVAISARRETSSAVIPLRWLSRFDASEPLFQQPGWHPAVLYHTVDVLIGRPVRVDSRLRSRHRRRPPHALANEITQCCQEEIANLLRPRSL